VSHRTPRARARLRRWLAAGTATAVTAALATALASSPSTAATTQEYWVPADGKLVLDGHGYGHGRGMSQYGARGAARSGVAWQDILGFYYPGTTLGRAGGKIRVLLTGHTSSTLRVSPVRGLRVRDLADGSTWRLGTPTSSTSRWELRENANGRLMVMYLDAAGWHRWRVPGRGNLLGGGAFQATRPLTLWNGSSARRYRERLQTARSGGRLRVVNQLSLERYLFGVVPAEMPSSWELDALRAQSVAARTYALRHRSDNPRRWYHVDDTISFQVYGGVDSEAASTNRAVVDTAGTVVRYEGAPALTEFSSSSGGWTAAGGPAYQVAKPDPYDAPSGNPYADWTQTIDVGVLESRYPSIGDLKRIDVTRSGGGDWGGRVDRATLVGSTGTASISGHDFRMLHGLRSTWFAPRPTPIIEHWRRIGGAGSPVGSPTAPEYATNGGTAQRFETGRVFHHPRVGAAATYGPTGNKYLRRGGTGSIHRFPRRDPQQGVAGVATAVVQSFQVGRIYHHPDTGPHSIYGRIAGRYYRIGGPASSLGFPRSDVQQLTDGQRSLFQGGHIRWIESTDTVRVVRY
jgi:stage II sporulation protein D